MMFSMLCNLANNSTTSVEGPSEGYRSEIVDFDDLVGLINNGALDASDPCRQWYEVGRRSIGEMLIRDF